MNQSSSMYVSLYIDIMISQEMLMAVYSCMSSYI